MSKRQIRGIVTSVKMNQTAIVTTAQKKQHPIYLKRFVRHTKFAAHNPENKFELGDEVMILETRPISKTKRWVILERVAKDESTEKSVTKKKSAIDTKPATA